MLNNKSVFCVCLWVSNCTHERVGVFCIMTVPTKQGVPLNSVQNEKSCAASRLAFAKQRVKIRQYETVEILHSNYKMAFGRMSQRGVIIALQQNPLSSPGEEDRDECVNLATQCVYVTFLSPIEYVSLCLSLCKHTGFSAFLASFSLYEIVPNL